MAAAMDDQILYDVFIRSEWNLEGELLVSILNHKPEGRENIIPKNSIILYRLFWLFTVYNCMQTWHRLGHLGQRFGRCSFACVQRVC